MVTGVDAPVPPVADDATTRERTTERTFTNVNSPEKFAEAVAVLADLV